MQTRNGITAFYTRCDVFSNFYMSDDHVINYNGFTFYCSEQLFMYLKARFFYDSLSMRRIVELPRNNKLPMAAKMIGRGVKNFDKPKWDEKSYPTMLKTQILKYTQNSFASDRLIDTGSNVLVEASDRDIIWGCGYSETDPRTYDQKLWRGKNNLGRCLMQTREILVGIIDAA